MLRFINCCLKSHLSGDSRRFVGLQSVVIQQHHRNASKIETGHTMRRRQHVAIVDERASAIEFAIVLQ